MDPIQLIKPTKPVKPTNPIQLIKLRNRMRYLIGVLTFLVGSLSSFSVVAADDELVYIKRVPEQAVKAIGLLDLAVEEFSPSSGQKIKLGFSLEEESTVTLDLMSADGDLMRRLIDEKKFSTGSHEVLWDGRDDQGSVVPNEAWVPIFRARTPDKTYIDEPSTYSGGEVIPNIQWRRGTENSISYELPATSRVLVRMGVKDGPMMRELRHWQPAVAGRIVDRWNGYDINNVEYFADRQDIWVVVQAYQLPEYSVVTTGNTKVDYRGYRKQRNWPDQAPDLSSIQLQRNRIRLSQNYFLPRSYLPRVSLDLNSEHTVNRVDLPEVDDTIRFRIAVPDEDKWILDSSFYETSLYIDYQFHSEEEQGFVPMDWEFYATELPSGRHIATVQLFGFGGFISSSTVAFFKK